MGLAMRAWFLPGRPVNFMILASLIVPSGLMLGTFLAQLAAGSVRYCIDTIRLVNNKLASAVL